jgi:hypothetical protein
MGNTSTTDTIEGLIAHGKAEEFANSKFYFKKVVTPDKGDSFVMNVTSIIDKYYDIIIRDYTETYNMTDTQYRQYRYNPKRLSYDYFGTVELWAIILRINNMPSVVDFNKQSIVMFTDAFTDILSEILALENDAILTNNEQLKVNNT